MLNPHSSRICAFAIKAMLNNWIGFTGAVISEVGVKKYDETNSDCVAFKACDLIGEPLKAELLTASEGFFTGFLFAINVASHVLTDPFGDPSLLIEHEVGETRDYLGALAQGAQEFRDEECLKEERRLARQGKAKTADRPALTASRTQRPPREMLEAPRGPQGFDPLALGC